MGRHRKEVLPDGTIVEDILASEPVDVQPKQTNRRGRTIKQVIDAFYHELLSHPDCKIVEHGVLKVPNSALLLSGVHPLDQKLLELKVVFKNSDARSKKDDENEPQKDPHGPGGKFFHLIPQRDSAMKNPAVETIPPKQEVERRVPVMAG
jgi:hypothetical protein